MCTRLLLLWTYRNVYKRNIVHNRRFSTALFRRTETNDARQKPSCLYVLPLHWWKYQREDSLIHSEYGLIFGFPTQTGVNSFVLTDCCKQSAWFTWGGRHRGNIVHFNISIVKVVATTGQLFLQPWCRHPYAFPELISNNTNIN